MTDRCTALVTGAARGIGLACARRLASDGSRVILVDANGAALLDACSSLPADSAFAVVADIAAAGAAAAIDARLRTHGWHHVDVLVNNAGISPKHGGRARDIIDIDPAEWQRVLDVNLTATAMLCRHFLPGMRERRWGRVVNVSSLAGRTAAHLSGPAYMASKAGLLALARHIASRFGTDGITANCVAPGRILTDMATGHAAVGENTQSWNSRNPSGREGLPEEVAAAVAFLASPQAAYCNGTVLDVNGGMFMA